MQLILVDHSTSTTVGVSQSDDKNRAEFSVCESVIRDNLLLQMKRGPALQSSGEERARKKLISELMSGNPKISDYILINLRRGGELTIKAVRYLSTCIFKTLALKFQENVKISVYIQDYTRDMAVLASAEGMEIDPTTFGCKGIATEITEELKLARKMHVTVMADITDLNWTRFPQKVLEMEALSDLLILAENGAKIWAHKSFLFVCSPVLQAMLRSGMKESKTGTVDMSDVSEQGVKAFLRYVYIGDLHEAMKDIHLAFELLYVGHKYDVPGLEDETRGILLAQRIEDFSVESAYKMYMFTKNIESKMELKIKAIQILKSKWDEFETSVEYKDVFEKPSNSKIVVELCRDLAKTVSPSSASNCASNPDSPVRLGLGSSPSPTLRYSNMLSDAWDSDN